MRKKLLLISLLVFGATHAQTYTNSNPEAITDATNATGNCGNATNAGSASSFINVPITATITNPADVTINLDLTHTWLGDIVAELVTPSGSSCALIKRIGAGTDPACGNGSDLIAGNILSFNSANTLPVPTTNPVPGGSYLPTGGTSTYPATIPLCDLSTFLNGVEVNGDWVLNLQDNGVGDEGTLNSWELVFNILGQEEFIFTNSVSVLGNPFQNELVVKVNNPNAQSAFFSLYSMDGKLVDESTFLSLAAAENSVINTTKLSQGVYVLVAEVDGVKQKGIRVIRR